MNKEDLYGKKIRGTVEEIDKLQRHLFKMGFTWPDGSNKVTPDTHQIYIEPEKTSYGGRKNIILRAEFTNQKEEKRYFLKENTEYQIIDISEVYMDKYEDLEFDKKAVREYKKYLNTL